MLGLLKRFVFPIKEPKSPVHNFLNYGSIGLATLSLVVFSIGGYFTSFDYYPPLTSAAFGLLGILLYFVAINLFAWLCRLLSKFPTATLLLLAGISTTLYVAKSYVFRWPDRPYLIGTIAGILLLGITFGSLGLFQTEKKTWFLIPALLSIGITGFVGGWLLGEGQNPKADIHNIDFHDSQLSTSEIELLDPSQTGKYNVINYTYGSGTDFRRTEYGKEVNFTSSTVNASLLLPEWKGKKKKWREKYWKFGVDSFPINGRISMPSEDGTYPLVLIVHGNHGMTDYSDEGYQYLTDLLASRGYIGVSVDENFINGHWSGDFRGKEMPARAWLLLKHIKQISKWNAELGHELSGKVDLNNIMLIGHSRGGEAVSIASVFNNLDRYPDNAVESFEFGYDIKSVISIAPTDYRYDRKAMLRNVNYLSIQGSYDSDESSFWGFRPYHRMEYDDENEWIKAAVLVDKANHGQFNSTWNRSDTGPPMSWLMNTKPILVRADQEKTAQVLISAFADATLKGDRLAHSIFKNARIAQNYLPNNYLLSNFQTSNFTTIANFEEDINPTTSDKATITAQNFQLWKEEQLLTRDGESQENNALVLGWDYGEKMNADSIAKVSFQLKDSLTVEASELVISIARGNLDLLKSQNKKLADTLLDFRIVLNFRNGENIYSKMSDVKPIAPRIKVLFAKEKSVNERYGEEWEVQLESFHIPFSNFDSEIKTEQISSIDLVFDQCNYGVVYIDDLGFDN